MEIQELMRVIQSGDLAKFVRCLDADASLANWKSPQGVSLLMMTAYMRQPAIAGVLLDRGAKPDFFEFLALGDVEAVRHELKKNPALAGTLGKDGFTPLCLAAHFGHDEIVKLLLETGADPNQGSENSMRVRPLHSAVAGHSEEVALKIVKMLVACGGDPNLRQENGWAPLHEAVAQSHKSVVEFLVNHGADPNAAGTDGRTPKDFVKEGCKDIAALLVR